MPIEIIPIGGYSEVGRNCIAIRADNEVVILDMGLHLERYINYTDSDDFVELSSKKLLEIGAIPDVTLIEDIKDEVKAICVSHAHLDHVGAIPFLGNRFKCPVHGTPFTIEVLKAILRDEKIDLRNELIEHKVNSRFKISKNIEVEFINATHSTPQTVMIAVHTKYGTVLYANDFKLDNHPTLGQKTNYKRLKEMNVKVAITNCLYAHNPARTPSESIAKKMLEDVLLGTNTEGKSIFVTTFSSHLARIKAIIQIAKKLNRKVVFLGRSLSKYADAGEEAGIVKFSKEAEIVRYSSKVRGFLSHLKHPEKNLFVVTGNQGEPKAILSKIVYNGFFKFKPGDMVIFSCQIIPVPIHFENRDKLETALKQKHVRIFRDVHSSGHASREDHRDFFELVKPKHIIPTHGSIERLDSMRDLAIEMGYDEHKVHILSNGQNIFVE